MTVCTTKAVSNPVFVDVLAITRGAGCTEVEPFSVSMEVVRDLASPEAIVDVGRKLATPGGGRAPAGIGKMFSLPSNPNKSRTVNGADRV